MIIETKNNEIIIRISSSVSLEEIQDSLDYIELKELTSKSEATQQDVDKLTEEINQSWWDKNKAQYFPYVR